MQAKAKFEGAVSFHQIEAVRGLVCVDPRGAECTLPALAVIERHDREFRAGRSARGWEPKGSRDDSGQSMVAMFDAQAAARARRGACRMQLTDRLSKLEPGVAHDSGVQPAGDPGRRQGSTIRGWM